MMKQQTLSTKLVIIYATLFSAVFFMISAAVLWCTYTVLINEQKSQIIHTMEIVQSHCIEELDEGDPINDPDLLLEQSFDLQLNVLLYDSDGKILNHVRNFYVDEQSLPRDSKHLRVINLKNHGLLLSYYAPLYNENVFIGNLHLIYDLKDETHFLFILSLLLIGANLLGIMAAAIVGYVVSRKMLSPIDHMIREVEQIDSQHLLDKKRIAVPEPNDELKRLATTLNRMLERVEKSFEQQSRFSADASHELRTPLSIIQGNVDMLMRWGKDDPEILSENIQIIANQTNNMNLLVENLLRLSRSDHEAERLNIDLFSVRDLLQELVAEHSKFDSKHDYFVLVEVDYQLNADREMVKQMLNALIHNSQKFTPDNGKIMLSSKQVGDEILLAVTDTGIGIDQVHLNHVFDRFYRVDESRNRINGGHGLGLSIVKAIASAHHAKIDIQSVLGQTTTVSILFSN